jgi:hypothetical protein
MMHERSDENSLARSRQASHADAKACARDVISQAARRDGAVVKDVGDVQNLGVRWGE